MKHLARIAESRPFGAVVHRITHRSSAEACRICEAVWRSMLAEPGFEDRLRAGIADMEAGRWYRRNRDGSFTRNPDWPDE